MTPRRLRWLPRFSIGNLLMLMVIVGLCLAWYDQRRKLGERVASFEEQLSKQAEVIEEQRLKLTQLTVSRILLGQMTDADKAEALKPYIKLRDSRESVEKWAGEMTSFLLHGPGFSVDHYDCGLVVHYYPNDLACAFGYDKPVYDKDGNIKYSGFSALVSDDPITWPMTAQRKSAEGTQ